MPVSTPTSPFPATSTVSSTPSVPPSTPEAAKTDAPKREKPAVKRDYEIVTSHEGDVSALKAAIDETVKDGKCKIYIVHGTEKAVQPRPAIKAYGEKNELKGDYATVAMTAFTEFPGLESEVETKRKIKGL